MNYFLNPHLSNYAIKYPKQKAFKCLRYIIFLKIHLFIWKTEIQRERDGMRSHPLDSHNHLRWARPQPETRSFIWVSSVSIGAQWLHSSSTLFPGTLTRTYLDQKWTIQNCNYHPYPRLILQAKQFNLTSYNADPRCVAFQNYITLSSLCHPDSATFWAMDR